MQQCDCSCQLNGLSRVNEAGKNTGSCQVQYLKTKSKLDQMYVPSSLKLCTGSVPLVNQLIKRIEKYKISEDSHLVCPPREKFASKCLQKGNKGPPREKFVSKCLQKGNKVTSLSKSISSQKMGLQQKDHKFSSKHDFPESRLIEYIKSIQSQNQKLRNQLLFLKQKIEQRKFTQKKQQILKYSVENQGHLTKILKKRQNQLFEELNRVKFKYNQLFDFIHQDLKKEKTYIKRLLKYKRYEISTQIVNLQSQNQKGQTYDNSDILSFQRLSKNSLAKIQLLEAQISLLNSKITHRDEEIQRLQQGLSISFNGIQTKLQFQHQIKRKNQQIRNLQHQLELLIEVRSVDGHGKMNQENINLNLEDKRSRINQGSRKSSPQGNRDKCEKVKNLQRVKSLTVIRGKNDLRMEKIIHKNIYKAANIDSSPIQLKVTPDKQLSSPKYYSNILKPILKEIPKHLNPYDVKVKKLKTVQIQAQNYKHKVRRIIQLPQVRISQRKVQLISEYKQQQQPRQKEISQAKNEKFIQQIKRQMTLRFQVEKISLISENDLLRKQFNRIKIQSQQSHSKIKQLERINQKYDQTIRNLKLQIQNLQRQLKNHIPTPVHISSPKNVSFRKGTSPAVSSLTSPAVSRLNSPYSSRNKPIASQYASTKASQTQKYQKAQQTDFKSKKIESSATYRSFPSSKFNQKEKQVTGLNNQIIVKQVDSMSKQLEQIKVENHSLTKQNDELRNQNLRIGSKLQKQKNSYEQVLRQKGKLKKNIESILLRNQLDLLNYQNHPNKMQNLDPLKSEEFEARLKDTQKKIRQKQLQIVKSEQIIGILQKKVMTLEKDKAFQMQKCPKMNQTIKQLIQTISQGQKQRVQLNFTIQKQQTQILHIKAQLLLLSRELQMLRSTRDIPSPQYNTSNIISQLKSQIRKLQAKYEQLVYENKCLIKGSFDLENQNQELRKKLQNKHVKLLELERQVEILTNEAKRIQGDILEKMIIGSMETQTIKFNTSYILKTQQIQHSNKQ